MFNRTPETDQELINILGVRQGANEELLNKQKPALEACKDLIDRIRKDYHLN